MRADLKGSGNVAFRSRKKELATFLGCIDVVVVGVASCVEGFEILQSADMHVDTR
jgi:hypothetical protein